MASPTTNEARSGPASLSHDNINVASPTLAKPEAKELQACFPTIDGSVIAAVLEAHHFDVDASVGALLSMADPDFKPERQDTAGDEALARQVALGDQPHPPMQPSAYPYRQYVRPSKVPPLTPRAPSPQATGRDELQKLQEDFQRFAGVGKRTVAGWLNSARTKYQELQQRQETSDSKGQPQTDITPAASSQGPIAAGDQQRLRPSRITAPLPHGGRYDEPLRATTTPTETTSTPQSHAAGTNDDDNSEHGSLEYVRNPFEDED